MRHARTHLETVPCFIYALILGVKEVGGTFSMISKKYRNRNYFSLKEKSNKNLINFVPFEKDSKTIHNYGKVGGMYIFPGCIANVNLNKDDTRSSNNEKF